MAARMLTNIKHTIARHIANVILPNGLYCFNYHRVGEASLTEYDPMFLVVMKLILLII